MPSPRLSPDRKSLGLPLAAVLLICSAVIGTFFAALTADAQTAKPFGGVERYGRLTAEERVELQETLNRQVDVLQRQAEVVKTVAKLIGPTVVFIRTQIDDGLPDETRHQYVEEAGSGVIVELNKKHYVLTNYHVIKTVSPKKIKITLDDGRLISPKKVWVDTDTDIAVLEIIASNLVTAPIGDSDEMEIGDFVLAVGSPFGLSHSVTYGIISAKGRRNLDLGNTGVRLQNFMQTDAAINPGNSGGPLINLHGKVIGINTAIASNSGGNYGIGFAIPINMYMSTARQLVNHGKVVRAYLGVKLDSNFGPAMAVEVGLPRPIGARITHITSKSPAAAADLRVNDVILRFRDVIVEDDAHLVNLVSCVPIGSKVSVVIFRDREHLNIEIALADRSDFE